MTDTKIFEQIEKKIVIEVATTLDLKEFFKNRDGLYVFSSFEGRILEKSEPTGTGVIFDVSSYKIIQSATDEEIENSLPEKHVFSETEVCAVIAELIQKQSKGEEGTLLNDGWWNLFYTPSCVVSVRWSGAWWSVFAWRRGGGHWRSLDRVFSPAAGN